MAKEKRIQVLAAGSQQELADDGAVVSQDCGTIKEAKTTAKYWVSPAYARNTGMSEPLGYSCVLVNDVIVYDYFGEGASPAVEYIVVGLGLAGGALRFKSREKLIRGLADMDIRYTGDNKNPNLKPMLRGQPKFDGLLGPMYGGPNLVRYETGAAYRELSR